MCYCYLTERHAHNPNTLSNKDRFSALHYANQRKRPFAVKRVIYYLLQFKLDLIRIPEVMQNRSASVVLEKAAHINQIYEHGRT